MNVLQAVKGRRSVRRYGEEMVKDDVVGEVIEAGVWAPSGLNNQPWKFKVLKEKGPKDGLAEFTRYGWIIEGAPVAVCVFLDSKAGYSRDKDLQAIGACIQNMLLRACELGLGTCWLGEILNRRQEVEEYLGTGHDYELMAVITLGYPAESEKEGSRRQLESFILD